ncbi:MAG: hypothetical protein JXA33_22655 [Anaerolineae bacterium]|nr:hypothetical protein [Anaerolineae bacterium]
MRTKYPYLQPGQKPITTVDVYLRLKTECDRLQHQDRKLRMGLKDIEKTDTEKREALIQEIKSFAPTISKLEFEIGKRTPVVLIAICPFCGIEVWHKVGIFSLLDSFWYQSSNNGKWVFKDSKCPHLFCVDGALNLHDHTPTEQSQAFLTFGATAIVMAAGVPFVKPRVLSFPTMQAVIHSIPVAERYTAYPVVYFAERLPAEHTSFCIPWASTGFDGWHPYRNGQKIGFTGKRSDRQEYELRPWIERGKLQWVDPVTEDKLIGGPPEAFPYASITGKRHPYIIKKGEVHDLPDPVEGKPEVILGDLVPHHA